MEINITQFYNGANPTTYSASCAELGDNAGRITWDAAMGADFLLLDSPEKLDAMRAWARSSGGWDDAEIAAWDDAELNALFIQLVAGDIREKGGALSEGIDGGIYYCLEG